MSVRLTNSSDHPNDVHAAIYNIRFVDAKRACFVLCVRTYVLFAQPL